MYKLLIVDDEEIEREGMVHFIPWTDYDVELVGSAWNGVEGLEMIEALQPDIVLTDIKMPVMNGIELIRRTRQSYPQIEFVVLSGYGEYEFTSQAMEEGIRHYILKPCDEEKILTILEKVKAEIDAKRSQRERERGASETIHRLMPRAREQVFRNCLLGREQLKQDYQSFLREYESAGSKIRIVAMRSSGKIDELQQFVCQNVFSELLGSEKMLLSTVIEETAFFMAGESSQEGLMDAVRASREELGRILNTEITAAVSEEGTIDGMPALYGQLTELFRIGEAEKQTGVLSCELFREMRKEASTLINYEELGRCSDYAVLLSEVMLVFMKMQLRGYGDAEKERIADWMLKTICGTGISLPEQKCDLDRTWELYRITTDELAANAGIELENGKEQKRVKDILFAIFRYIGMPELSIQFLAKEVLFMNEDYLGRIFFKNRGIKFSAFLLEQRIGLAMRLLEYDPDLKISILAELTGYSPDGQYFSKAFKKVSGVSPSEYRETIRDRRRETD